MRIYGNRQLKTVPGQAIRPTSALVREAVFNIWQGDITNCRWLDLCAGNGSMGAEAMCRGASLVVGIEKWAKACAVIQQNWQQVAQPNQDFRVIRGDVVRQLKFLAGEQFDRIYFDPPYASKLYQPVLEAIAHYQLLDKRGELAVEHSPNKDQSPPYSTLEICRQKVYGKTALTFYRLQHS
ncbi:MAG: 16S rRNA (guanine(966)-N(2))-methyltransferase RsmD [Symploca sp. SIO2E6]|nr:16S rRNA (guanine(966)-N(2))-methyltransferase RsmD [Symploca sp. SIO2E6]